MPHFTPEQKHEILLEYQPRSTTHSFPALAARHGVGGGERTIRNWFARWDRTPASLQHKEGAGRPSILTRMEVQRHIAAPVRKKNRAGQRVTYSEVADLVREKTGKQIANRTVRQYGKEQLGIKKTTGRKRSAEECECTHMQGVEQTRVSIAHVLIKLVALSVHFSVSPEMCEEIAKMRRKLQRIGTNHILFLDETHKREGDVENHTIVLPGEPPYIHSSNTSKYATRFDMIACCSGTTSLPPIIYSPKERDKGITQEMLLQYIRNLLAQSAGALDTYPLLLVLDRATIHNENKIIETFHDWGCQELTQVIKMPSAAAKRLSPLDNSLFNVWRQRVLNGGPLTKSNIKQRMSDAWNSITSSNIHAQYRHCGLMRGQDVYFDCPNPAAHRHGS
jgi:transposase